MLGDDEQNQGRKFGTDLENTEQLLQNYRNVNTDLMKQKLRLEEKVEELENVVKKTTEERAEAIDAMLEVKELTDKETEISKREKHKLNKTINLQKKIILSQQKIIEKSKTVSRDKETKIAAEANKTIEMMMDVVKSYVKILKKDQKLLDEYKTVAETLRETYTFASEDNMETDKLLRMNEEYDELNKTSKELKVVVKQILSSIFLKNKKASECANNEEMLEVDLAGDKASKDKRGNVRVTPRMDVGSQIVIRPFGL